MQAGDKRWATLLALDLVGFSALTQALGEERVYALLRAVLTVVREAVEAHGGHVVDTAGDGVLAGFGAPVAVETASLQACRAAAQVLADLGAQRFVDDFGVAPAVRIGLASGPVMVAEEPGAVKLVGAAVNLAARLEALAAPGTVVMTADVAREVDGFVTVADPEAVTVKGYDAPVSVVRLGGLIDVATRFEGVQGRGLSTFVSRADELARAVAVLAGQGALLVSGVAGIGKSRLVHEMGARVQRPLQIGQCAPDLAGRPFAPVEQVIAAGRGGEGGFAAQVAALCGGDEAAALARYQAPRGAELDPVGRLLHDRAFLCRVLGRMQGAVCVLEDLHWADSATLDLLPDLIAAGVPLVLTTREAAALAGLQGVVPMPLQPLGGDDTAAILAARAPTGLAPGLQDRMVARAEGIPLVAEEIAYALTAADLVATPEGMDLKDPGNPVFSGNLQQLILSRVDRLPKAAREVLQVASAIGRDFDWDVVGRVLGEALSEDVARFDGIVESVDAGRARFSHALIREAVYGGLLTERRRSIHAQVAQAMVAGVAVPRDAVLADHYLAADLRPEAAVALTRAGEAAFEAYDLGQADRRFAQAFDLVHADPGVLTDADYVTLCDLWMRTRSVYGLYRDILEVADAFLPRLEAVPYAPGVSIARAIVALAKTGARDYAVARDLAQAAIATAEAAGDAYGAAWAKSTLARVYDETHWEGPAETQRLCAEILPVAEAAGDRLLAMTAHYLTLASYRACGLRWKALETAEAIEAIAETYDDRRARAYANWARAVVYSNLGQPEAAAGFVAEGQKHVVPLTTDSRVLAGVGLFTEVFSQPAETVRPRLAAMRAEAERLLDYNLIHSFDWIRAVLELRAGHLADGWQMTERMAVDFPKAGNVNLTRQNLITRAEVVLTVLGLIDPDAEAPEDRPVFPKARPGVRDIWTFLRLKAFGRGIAARDLQACCDLDPAQTGAHFARAKIGLGLLAMARGQGDRAREDLGCGLNHAREEGIEVLVARAKAALDTLSDT